jgi:hypothetical protein
MKIPQPQEYVRIAAPEIDKLDNLEIAVRQSLEHSELLKLTPAQIVTCFGELRKVIYLRSMLKGLIEPEGDRD